VLPDSAHSLSGSTAPSAVPCPLPGKTQSPPSMAPDLTGTSSTLTESGPVALPVAAVMPTDQMMTFPQGRERPQMEPSPGAPARGPPGAVGTPTLPADSGHSLSGRTVPSKGPCPLPGSSSTLTESGPVELPVAFVMPIDQMLRVSAGQGVPETGPSPEAPTGGPLRLWEPLLCYQT